MVRLAVPLSTCTQYPYPHLKLFFFEGVSYVVELGVQSKDFFSI